jgi:hypothetical protein
MVTQHHGLYALFMPEYATITADTVDTYEFGLMAFTVGEQVRIIARAIRGPEARTLVEDELGLRFHVEDERDLLFPTSTVAYS